MITSSLIFKLFYSDSIINISNEFGEQKMWPCYLLIMDLRQKARGTALDYITVR